MDVLEPYESAVDVVVTDGGRLVPDKNVHKGNNCPPFGTRGILTFDISIGFYKITHFLSSFLYFALQEYPQGRKRRGYCPHFILADTFRYDEPIYTPLLLGYILYVSFFNTVHGDHWRP